MAFQLAPQVIILNRLRNQYQVKQIGLEGFIRERPELNAAWYGKAAHESTEAAQSVAARLLGEGEYSSAEFMKLIYDDMKVIPVETKSEYEFPEPNTLEVDKVCWSYFYQLALQSLRPQHEAKLMKLNRDAEKYKSNETTFKKKIEEMRKYISSVGIENLSDDTWVKEKWNVFKQTKHFSICRLKKKSLFMKMSKNTLPTTRLRQRSRIKR